MNPSGVQLARPMRPPLRTTRSISFADFRRSGVNMTPNVDSATSKLPSSNGSDSASAVLNVTVKPSAAARAAAFARALRDSRSSVAAIALEVGYDLEAAFARAFKRLVGMPPAAWRRKQGESPAPPAPASDAARASPYSATDGRRAD